MEFLVGLHSLWRWVVLLFMVIALVRSLMGWFRNSPWTANDRTTTLLATSAIDIQFLLGLIVYGMGQHWNGTAFIAYIHPTIMLIALVIVHLTSTMAKRQTSDVAKHRMIAIGLLIALFLVTAAIPSYSWARAWAA